MSPARSRDSNDDCELMGFFNSHDIWHFLSAIALFFSLLVSLPLLALVAIAVANDITCYNIASYHIAT